MGTSCSSTTSSFPQFTLVGVWVRSTVLGTWNRNPNMWYRLSQHTLKYCAMHCPRCYFKDGCNTGTLGWNEWISHPAIQNNGGNTIPRQIISIKMFSEMCMLFWNTQHKKHLSYSFFKLFWSEKLRNIKTDKESPLLLFYFPNAQVSTSPKWTVGSQFHWCCWQLTMFAFSRVLRQVWHPLIQCGSRGSCLVPSTSNPEVFIF